MALSRVEVTQDAYLCMLSHALSTEYEEVMGLLCGVWLTRVCTCQELRVRGAG